VLMRVATLSGGPALARAVAVLGDGATLPQAARLAALDEPYAAKAADLLVRASILKRGRELEFVHPIVRQAVYADLAPHERAELHSRAAGVLEAAGAPAERVAAHLLATEMKGDQRVIEILRAAASEASRRGMPEAAIRYLERALDERPAAETRADLLLELGQAKTLARLPEAIEDLSDALDLASDAGKTADAGLALARALALVGRPQESAEAFRRTLDKIGVEHPELRLTLESEMLLVTRLASDRPRPLPADLARHRPQATPAGTPPERGLLAFLVSEAALRNERADLVCNLAERALANGRLLSERGADSPLYYAPVLGLLFADGYDAAARALDAALTAARAQGSATAAAMALCFRSHLHYRLGRLADAESDARQSLALAEEHGWRFGLPAVIAYLVDTLLEQGALEPAAEIFESRDCERLLAGAGEAVNAWLERRGKVKLLRGHVRDGLRDILACGRQAQAQGDLCPGNLGWRSNAALAHAALGDDAEARRLADEQLRLARAFGAPRALGTALRAKGLVDRSERGIEVLHEAVAVLEGSQARLEHARALTDLGAALRRANRRSEAREPLRDALELAHRCGATALIERAREEFEATGARSRRLFLSGAEALTPSERRIAALAADGHSNREIAQALFVTQKTVETHLSNAYRKLDVSSRSELPARLASEQGTPEDEAIVPTETAGPAKP
ncbi:MAG: LuxR C-terminal-related transcriptional regulator, partial [Chloroflexota bacterium]|nr:LuxR C-terminal-related transcriptional regulator [Chloroflexota bacterium]